MKLKEIILAGCIFGISSLIGCQKRNEVLSVAEIKLYDHPYRVEIRSPHEYCKGKRLFIYDKNIEQNKSKSKFEGLSFAVDVDGDEKIDTITGPISELFVNIQKDNENKVFVDEVKHNHIENKLNEILEKTK